MSNPVVEAARSWLGTRFHHQARVKGVGCDCVGLVIGVRKELGFSDFDTKAYSRIPDGRVLKNLCDEHMTPIDFADLQAGDVLLFKFKDKPQHLAIVGDYSLGGFSIIHAYSIARKVIETRLDDAWTDKIVACYRIKKDA